MWYVMANAQSSYQLSDRLIRAISHWQTSLTGNEDDIEALLDAGADVNRLHGTLLPLHCACMVGDSDCAELLIQRGAQVTALLGLHKVIALPFSQYYIHACRCCLYVMHTQLSGCMPTKYASLTVEAYDL